MIANGMPWKAHLYLMIVSAKLLADTEGMLQVQAVQGSWSGVVGRLPVQAQQGFWAGALLAKRLLN